MRRTMHATLQTLAPMVLAGAALGCPPRLRDDEPVDIDSVRTADNPATARAADAGCPPLAEWHAPNPPVVERGGWSGGGSGSGFVGCEDVREDDWIKSHGAKWGPDAACWVSDHGRPWSNLCTCGKSLRVGGPRGVELLLCNRWDETGAEASQRRGRIVFYRALGGRMQPVLNVLVDARIDLEEFPADIASSMGLEISVDGNDVVFDDRGDCQKVLKSVDPSDWKEGDYLRPPLDDLVQWHRGYARVCASVGHWRWTGTAFVHESTLTPK